MKWLLLMLCSCTVVAPQSKTYSQMNQKCDITIASFNNGFKPGCYCKVTGTSEHGKEVIIYIPIEENNCK